MKKYKRKKTLMPIKIVIKTAWSDLCFFRSATEDVSRTPIAVEKSGGDSDTPLKTIVQVRFHF